MLSAAFSFFFFNDLISFLNAVSIGGVAVINQNKRQKINSETSHTTLSFTLLTRYFITASLGARKST